MKVRLLTARASATMSKNAGEVIEVSAAEAAHLIARGQAQPVRDAKSPERAVKRSGDKAVR